MATGHRRRFAQRRKAMGHTQESLAETLCVDRTTVVRWERGETQPQPWLRRPLAKALAVSLDELELLLSSAHTPDGLDTLGNHPFSVGSSFLFGGGMTNRRQFALGAAVTALGATIPLRGGLAEPHVPARIGDDHLRWLTTAMDGFERADAAIGGDTYCDIAIGLYQQASRWARESSFGAETGARLQSALGQLEAWIGWLALDSERRQESRRYLQAALTRARLINDPALEVRALQQLAMLLRDAQPGDALRYVEIAQRVSAGRSTPRLSTLLHLRAARAHASLHDTTGFHRSMTTAKAQFALGTSDDDPSYLGFVNPLEMSGIEALSHLVLDRPARAAEMLREVTEKPDLTYRRNHTLCTVRLAEATHREGDITGAAEVALAAVPAVAALRSARTRKHYAGLRAKMETHIDRVPAARDFVEAYDATMMP